MRINVLKQGDTVINVTSEFIAIRRKNGEVDLVPIFKDGETWRVDTVNIVTIGYGNNTVVYEGDGIELTVF